MKNDIYMLKMNRMIVNQNAVFRNLARESLTILNLCITEDIRMKINEYQELAMTTLNPELSKSIV